ncbi:MAG: hypothetical protein QOH47_2392 [Sphingomonadales bacterium]|jgi:hypothetical protein|nr:hypothetical protein [Sphingomonadales bacterium]
MSSIQEQKYLLARFVEKLSLSDAAFEAGIEEAEAKLIDQAVARGELRAPSPLQPGAAVIPLHAGKVPTQAEPSPAAPSRLLDAITPPDAGAPFNEGENAMPRGKAQPKVEEIVAPDFQRAVKIFRQDIKPANEKSGEHAQAASTAYKAIKKECHVNTRAAKFVFQLVGESEEKRNDVLRSFRGLLREMNIGITDDLVSRAEGEDAGAAIIPLAERQTPELVTVQ